MPTPGDLCLLQNLKAYMGGANPTDTTNDGVLASLITAASVFIAGFLDRNLYILGGQGISAIASVGSDAGGAYITLTAALPGIPPIGTQMTDFTSGATTSVIAPASGMLNTTSKLYLASTTSLSVSDTVDFAFQLTFIETYNGSGKPWQWVKQWPIGSLVSITDLPSGQPYSLASIVPDPELPRLMFKTVIANTSFILVLPTGELLGQIFGCGIQNLQVVYNAGYLTTPPDLSQAALEVALLWFKDRDHIDVSGQGMLGTHVNFFNTSDLLPQTVIKLNNYKRTLRGY
ncbi:MAG TPA: hypothetical protein VMB26_01935 [Candidatus Binataceae bacterium]|nr:hypothetical protein [Candidatus Binataceae bacterium]